MTEGKTPQHSMTRRAQAHDYTQTGIYHVTLRVAEGLHAPFGTVVGSIDAPEGSADAPHTELTVLGRAIEDELLTTLHARYGMVRVMEHVIMPDHLHALIHVTEKIVSSHGKVQPLGQVIAGFKKGCNRRYWELTGQGGNGGETATHTATAGAATASTGTAGTGSVPCGFPAGSYKVPSAASSGRPPLFAPGYCDVMPVDDEQLSTQRAYIRNNPRSRLLRTSNREWLQPRRGGIDTALSPSALHRYLRDECSPSQCTDEAFEQIEERLLMEGGKGDATGGVTAVNTRRVLVGLDTYGDRTLLKRRLLPVVCHRKDDQLRTRQHARCMEEAERGAVLVSPRIHKGEQAIIDEAAHHGFPVVLIADNGFPEVYHPSTERIDRCAAGRLLIVTPWNYQYRYRNEDITVMECKAMNCVAQAICRTRDDWWKNIEQ
ncbi:MAG: hypothetical protein IJ570_05990 [Prevotella sp.]|nr:hypothetical protein [Prevotella sp.]